MRSHELTALLRTAPDWVDDDRSAFFWMPERFNDGLMWIGRWKGVSPWERHATTDELLHVLEGEVTVTLLPEEGGREEVRIPAGSLFVVPRGLWHRVASGEDEVLACGVTPGPTDQSQAEDPRTEERWIGGLDS